MHTHDESVGYMREALALAEKGRYTVSPNPMVGCVIVKNHHIVGRGFHQRQGGWHAEHYALEEAKQEAKGATAYVTLEPCCHFGKTPPCVEALIHAGIKQIYIAALDPFKLVNGRGRAMLQSAGIQVTVGLLEQEARQLNEIFFYAMTHQRPFVIAKWAMSLDGKTITASQDARFISSETSQQSTHQLRQQVDAVLVGAYTVYTDNPQLTARHVSLEQTRCEKQPLRIVLMTRARLPLTSHLFDTNLAPTMVVATDAIDHDFQQALQNRGVTVWKESLQAEGFDLSILLKNLFQRDITSVLVEGGMQTHAAFFNAHLVNKIHVYLAPMIIGSLPKRKILPTMQVLSSGKDTHFIAEVPNV